MRGFLRKGIELHVYIFLGSFLISLYVPPSAIIVNLGLQSSSQKRSKPNAENRCFICHAVVIKTTYPKNSLNGNPHILK